MKIIKNTSYLVVGNLISQIIPLMALIVFSRMFSLEDFGQLAKFIATSMVLSTVSIGQLQHSIVVEKDDGKALSYYSYCLLINLVSVVLFGGILFVVNYIFQFSIFQFSIFGVSGILLIIFYAFLLSNIQILTFVNIRFEKYSIISVGKVVLGVSVAMITYLFGVNGFIGSLILGSFLGLFFQFFYLLTVTSKPDIKFHWISIKLFLIEYKKLPFYTLPHSFFDAIKKNVIVFIVGGFYGDSILGLFSIAEKIVRIPLAIVGTAFSDVFRKDSSIILHDQGAKVLYKTTVKYIRYGLLITIIPTLIVALNSELIFSYLLSGKWAQAGTFFTYLSPLVIAYFIASPLSVLPILFKTQTEFFIKVVILDIVLYLTLYVLGWFSYDISVLLIVKAFMEALALMYISYWIVGSIKEQKSRLDN